MTTTMAETYPVDLKPPDISPYRKGNIGIDYVFRFEAALPGPNVMISAVVHGNEICGAIALDYFLKTGLRPRRGALTLAFCNVDAYHRFDAASPTRSRYVDEDFNRLWGDGVLDGPGDSAERRRARALRPVIAEADYLLDIHSMHIKNEALVLAGPLAKGRDLARCVGMPRYVVSDHGHATGRRMRDFGDFARPESAKNALLVECGQHWELASERIAKETLFRFLTHTGCINPDDAAPHLGQDAREQTFIEVTHPITIRSSRFEFVDDYRGFEIIPNKGTILGYDGDVPVTTPYDNCILVMPAGRLVRGGTAVRLGRFIDV